MTPIGVVVVFRDFAKIHSLLENVLDEARTFVEPTLLPFDLFLQIAHLRFDGSNEQNLRINLNISNRISL